MKLMAVRLSKFKSFKQEQVFYLPSEPGLYFMVGKNEVEPRLGGNAAGKTTLWDAVLWNLFERTSKGLRAGDVCSWSEEKGTEVRTVWMDEEDKGAIYCVFRSWKPNKWILFDDAGFSHDLTKDKSNIILDKLRLTHETFLQSILNAQGGNRFLDLKREAQASLFSSVLGCDAWLERAERAAKMAREEDAVLRGLEGQLSRLQGQVEALGDKDFGHDSDEWKRTQERKIDAIKEKWDDEIARRKRFKAALEHGEKGEVEAREAFRKANNGVGEELRVAIDRERKELSRLDRELAKMETQAEDIDAQLRRLAENDACPLCGQEMTEAHVRAEQKKADARSAELALVMAKTKENMRQCENEIRTLGNDLNIWEMTLETAERRLEKARRLTADGRREFELLDRRIDALEDEEEKLREESNPFAEMAQEAIRKREKALQELETTQGRVDASQARYGLLSFWAKGFKEIRLQEISSALSELEIEVNSAVTTLGLLDWELNFAVDRENKGGGIVRGFDCTVKSPHQPYATPWEAWSGGESGRLRLAGNMGLGDLIRTRTGTPLNLEVWDEPTNGLSPEGIRDLLDSLAARARKEQRVIFITDHKAHDYGGFAGTATIIKTPSGSRIRTTWTGSPEATWVGV